MLRLVWRVQLLSTLAPPALLAAAAHRAVRAKEACLLECPSVPPAVPGTYNFTVIHYCWGCSAAGAFREQVDCEHMA